MTHAAADVSKDEPVPCPVLGPSPEVGEHEVDVGVGETTGLARCSGGECCVFGLCCFANFSWIVTTLEENGVMF